MRLIKFRAWCEEDKSMYYPDGNYEFHINSNAIYYSPRYDQQELYSYSTDKSEFEKEIVVMQFTGLFDKNGKEIYEGDIIDYGCGRNKVVEFKDGCFCICGITSMPTLMTLYPVIGNIYENGDLIP